MRIASCALARGGIVAYPTEGVYGLGCLPTEVAAIARLLAIKRRSWRKGLPLIAASIAELAPFVELPADGLRAEIEASWPGPVTWVLPARPGVPVLLTGGRRTLAVRVTGHPLAAALCKQARSALVSTSANRSGRPPLLTPLAVRRALG
ncbi:MAG TPA: L-threonylcarbamoyladenylate synthase, partial [Gammaproteobacteria bacterium]|nr:L-threonylcarbamoyladenylate synthase [Gammaproteobacteria bacterium]